MQNNSLPKEVVEGIEKQITYHEKQIEALRFQLKMLQENPPPQIPFFKHNPKLTKDLIRQFMEHMNKPVQTVEVIDLFFPNANQEVRNKAIKTLSVIFNTLEKDGQIKIEKKEGVKGNFYTWIG